MTSQTNGPPVPFSALPLNKAKTDAWFNAWGLYGDEDQKGFLNRVTDEMVAVAAREEIRTGKRISLDLPLDFQKDLTMFKRRGFEQEIILKHPRCVNDDIWTFNSQCTSQWDGLRHYAYQKARRFYNNVSPTQIVDPGPAASSEEDVNPTIDPKFIGVQNLAEQGIVGRGILLDFVRWRDAQLSTSPPSSLSAEEIQELQAFDWFKSCRIRHNWILEILRFQNVTPRYGDILLIRSGYLKAYFTLQRDQIEALVANNPIPAPGVDQDLETLQWIWDHFSAVAGDQPSFEAWPAPGPLSQAKKDSEQGTGPGWSYHEVLLAGWGCPIGELFDLEELGKECERQGRWTFFLVSEACKVPGGVASPPNILAMF